MMQRLHFEDRDILAHALANHLERRVAEALRRQPLALLVLAGGSSPIPVYEHLRERDIEWSRLQVTVTDERCVPERDPLSNAAMVRRSLLAGPASAAEFIPLYGAEATPEDAAASADIRLAELSWPAAAVLLGVGNDGHTASLFPSDPGLPMLLQSTARTGVARPTTQPTARISLTPRALLDAHELIVLGFGNEKRATFDALMPTGALAAKPAARLIERSRNPVTLYWAP